LKYTLNYTAMATITLKYDAKNQKAVKTLEYILSIGFFEPAVKEKKQLTPNPKTAKAIQNTIDGKNLSKSYSTTEELFKDLEI